jgi:hypothetical protein
MTRRSRQRVEPASGARRVPIDLRWPEAHLTGAMEPRSNRSPRSRVGAAGAALAGAGSLSGFSPASPAEGWRRSAPRGRRELADVACRATGSLQLRALPGPDPHGRSHLRGNRSGLRVSEGNRRATARRRSTGRERQLAVSLPTTPGARRGVGNAKPFLSRRCQSNRTRRWRCDGVGPM